MKYCSKCGAQLADDDMYCYNCGAEAKEKEKGVEREKASFDDYYENNYRNDNSYGYYSKNTMATCGLVFSFLSPILGLIFSIIGLNKSRHMNGLGRGQAIAGIIISIINFIISFFIVYYFFPTSIE